MLQHIYDKKKSEKFNQTSRFNIKQQSKFIY
jgi:hypothetical protein